MACTLLGLGVYTLPQRSQRGRKRSTLVLGRHFWAPGYAGCGLKEEMGALVVLSSWPRLLASWGTGQLEEDWSSPLEVGDLDRGPGWPSLKVALDRPSQPSRIDIGCHIIFCWGRHCRVCGNLPGLYLLDASGTPTVPPKMSPISGRCGQRSPEDRIIPGWEPVFHTKYHLVPVCVGLPWSTQNQILLHQAFQTRMKSKVRQILCIISYIISVHNGGS